MGADSIALLKRNIARQRRSIRLAAWEMRQLIEADLDCTNAARLLMRLESGLRSSLEELEQANHRGGSERVRVDQCAASASTAGAGQSDP